MLRAGGFDPFFTIGAQVVIPHVIFTLTDHTGNRLFSFGKVLRVEMALEDRVLPGRAVIEQYIVQFCPAFVVRDIVDNENELCWHYTPFKMKPDRF